MKWRFSIPVLVAAVMPSLLPIGCGPAAPTAAEKPKYPPGQDPEADFLPNTKKPAQ